MFKQASQIAALCVLLSIFNTARADAMQDAGKLFKQGQHAQALEKVDAYLAGKPKDAQARFLKGLILTEQGKTTEAIKVFTLLTDDYPELPEPYNNLAVLYAGQSQYEKAKVALEMAIRTHPSYATAHENLGDIYAKMASQAYDRALQLDRSNTATQTKLAMIKDLFSGKAGKSARPAAPAVTVESGAGKPAPVVAGKPSGKPSAHPKEEVTKTLQAWAAAWSAQNSDQYLAFYSSEFSTPDGLSRSAWEAQRRERIAKPTSIKVEIKDLKVTVGKDGHASVNFKQKYQASHLHNSTRKEMELIYVGGKWQIVEERASN